MSVEAITWALNSTECSGNDRVVLLVLANHAWPDGSHAFPAQANIARQACVSERCVRDCLRRLEADGYAIPDGKVGRTIRYRLPLGDEPATVAGSEKPADRREKPADSRQDSGNGLPPNRKEPTTEPSDTRGAREVVIEQATDNPDGRAALRALGDVAGERGADFEPAKLIDEARRYPDRDHVAEAIRFRDYYSAGGAGENVPVKSLRSRWRTWLSRAPSKGAGARARGNGRRRPNEPTSDELRAMAADLRARGL